MANTTNILLNSNNEIFTSPIIAYTNMNRNNALSTPTHSLINETTPSITIPPSAIDNNQSVFKLPEPFVSKDILYDSNIQKSNVIINQLQKKLENENFTYDNISLNEGNETIEKEEYHLPGSVMSLASLSPHTNYINERKNSSNIYDNVAISPYTLPKYKDSNENSSNGFSPLVGPMITGPMNFESSPTAKPISQSMLPITPSVLMHLDNQQASSLARKIRDTNRSKTVKQTSSSSSNVDLIDINDMKRILNGSSLGFTLSDMNVNIDTVNELNRSKNNDNITTPIYMDYVMKDNDNDLELDINLNTHRDSNHTINSQNKNIESNLLLTPLILDGSAIDFDHHTYSSLNNSLLLNNKNSSNQEDDNITSNMATTIATADLTGKSNRIENLNAPISVSTLFNRYNSKHKSETKVTKPRNTLNKNQINEAIDKLISSNKEFHETKNKHNINNSNDSPLNIPNIILENASDLSEYLKANAMRLKSSHSSIPVSSVISPNAVSLSNKAFTPEIIANATHPISPNPIFSNHSISPNIITNHPTSSTVSSISSSTNNNKKEVTVKSPNKKSKLKKKNSTTQNSSNNEKSVDNIISIPANNPNSILLLNNNKTNPKFTKFASPSPTAFSLQLSSIPKSELNETGTSFKSLPPPSISSNLSIIHNGIAHQNLPPLATSQSGNSVTISSTPTSSLSSTPSSAALSNTIVSQANKLKSTKSLKIKKPVTTTRITPLLPNKITSMDDAIKLASKSNYQNVLGGETTSLGLNPNLISGIEVRKTNHKNAEQKRRDSLKQGFENLKVIVPFISDKNPSKIMIITRSYEYICKLKENQKKYEKEMKTMKLKEKLYLEKLKSKGVDIDILMKELEEEITKDMKEEEQNEENGSISSSNTNIHPSVNSTNNTSTSTSSSSSNQQAENKSETKSGSNKRKLIQEEGNNKNSNSSDPISKKQKITNTSNLDKDSLTKEIDTTKVNANTIPVTSS
ncbi:hypothetical protein PIROE2DRAFT_68751 [Piromyces sp. E2]|nr:hypothetical protein PIROE2DRAFT_68751 [Piromyces sp. E2]|eukprot:OUM68026.1 hypothetical protein PIROE2DRAFT_68751 [Piromyces sp. E2]